MRVRDGKKLGSGINIPDRQHYFCSQQCSLNLPGGNDEAAEDVDEGDEGGGSGEPLHRIGGMVAAAHQQQPAHSCDTCNTQDMWCA
jgi:hypothetical protein